MSSEAGQSSNPQEPIIKVEEKKLVISFIQFLRHKVSAYECADAQIQELEIAVQCLENAFQLTDKNYAFQPATPLLQLLTDAEGPQAGQEDFPAPSNDDIQQANALKEEGNEFVKASKFHDAIEKYNQAIKLNRDPAFFCNRAAAYYRLKQYDFAIQDCRTALTLDEKYVKAYSRMGLALSCQNRYDAAIEAYKKAIELDPNNEGYKLKLAIAEEKVPEASQRVQNNAVANPFGGPGELFGAGGIGQLLNDPTMMNAAMQMMTTDSMQNLMGSMMEQFMGGSAGGANGPLAIGQNGSAGGADGGSLFADLLAAGQNMAQQMQEANPELVEQLRQQFARSSTDDSQQNHGNNPQDPDNQEQ